MRNIVVFLMLLALIGCAATGANLRSDVYRADQVNQVQQGSMIEVVKIIPAKIEVDNTQQKEKAQTAGGLIGALAGGLGVGLGTKSTGAGAVGAGAGGVSGYVAGSMVPDKVLVDGVTITYMTKDTGELLSSTQVGRLCEYREGAAYVVTTEHGETRVQPNNVCLEE